MRETIEKNLGIYVSDNYGMTELGGPGVSGDCFERDGMHFAEDHFLPEIIGEKVRFSQVLAAVSCAAAVIVLLWQMFKPHDPANLFVHQVAAKEVKPTENEAE